MYCTDRTKTQNSGSKSREQRGCSFFHTFFLFVISLFTKNICSCIMKSMRRVIFHVDVNSAFLSWEAVYRLRVLGETLDLREIPAAVGGDMEKRHGIILAKSPLAKKYGVRTGEPVVDAKRKCPGLVLVPPRHDLYKRESAALMEILREYSPEVEQFSVDEAFLDMTGMEALFGEPVAAAYGLKERIYRELGFTVNIGISENKLLAKMASDFEKPDKVHTLFQAEVPEKMWPMPVGELFLVGKATERRLSQLGIRTIGELAMTDVKVLKSYLKKHGELIWEFANGHDVSLVEPEPPENKGYGNSTTIAFDVTDAQTAKLVLLSLAETVASRLRRAGKKAEVISVSIKNNELHRESHQMQLESPSDITEELYEAACKLFDELWDQSPIRLLGIHAGKLAEGEGRQLNIFDKGKYEKLEKLDAALDSIRLRHGKDAVMRASFLESPFDHMTWKMNGKEERRRAGTAGEIKKGNKEERL